MNTVSIRVSAAVIAILFLVGVAMPFATATATDLAPLISDEPAPVEHGAAPFFERVPIITGFSGSSAIVEFATVEETPPGLIRFGPLHEVGGVERAAYRKIASEKSEEWTREHTILVDVSRLESSAYDSSYMDNGGGIVAYRLEVFDPTFNVVRTFDRRFRYSRSGPRRDGEYAPAETIVLGPCLDRVGPGYFFVSWETDTPSPGGVIIMDGESERMVSESRVDVRHEVLVAGLREDAAYAYRVQYGNTKTLTRWHDVRTAPDPGSRRPFTFGFASDSRSGVGGGEENIEGVNCAGLKAVLAGAKAHGADLFLFGGDLVDGYTSSEERFLTQLDSWRRASDQVAFSMPIYEGMGNHEQVGDYFQVTDPEHDGKRILMYRDRSGDDSVEALFSARFVNPPGSCYGNAIPGPERSYLGGVEQRGPGYGETVYSFNYDNCHFVSVNSNYWVTGLYPSYNTVRWPSDHDGVAYALGVFGGNREGYLLPEQLKWLKVDLDIAQSDPDIDWIFVFTHEPAFPTGGHAYDAMFWRDEGRTGNGGLNDADVPRGDVIDMRNRFWSILSSHDKVLAFMCGDEHNYSRTLIDSDIHPTYTAPVWQFVSGGAGAPFYVQDTTVPWSDHVKAFSPVNHYCIFHIDAKRVGLSVYATSGVLIDEVKDLAAAAGRSIDSAPQTP
jgi:hypothetical protein